MRGSERARAREFRKGAPDTRRRAENSHAAAFARTTAVMGNGRYVTDRGDVETRRLDRAQRRFASRTGTRDLDLERAHAMLGRLPNGVLRRDLRREWGRFAGPLESHRASRRPGDRVALGVGNGDHRIVE